MVRMYSCLKGSCHSIKMHVCAYVSGDVSESFGIGVGPQHECVMSPQLFDIYMNGCMREVKGKKKKFMRGGSESV